MIKKSQFLTVLLLIFSFLFLSCKTKSNSTSRIYLNNWEYSTAGDPYPFYDLKEKNLSNLSDYLDNQYGYIYLKSNFIIPLNFKQKDSALYIGRIKIASRIYINGHLIGTTGQMPPHEFTEGNKAFAFQLPKRYLNYGEKNTITIALWCHGYGSIDSMPFISDNYDVVTKADYDSLIYSKIYLIFTVILFIIFLIYIFLYLLRRSESENLTFGLLCLFTGIYLSVFYYGEYSYIGGAHITYLQFEKIFKGVTALIAGYLIVCFTRDFLHYKESGRGKLIRFLLTLIAAIIPLTADTIPDFRSRLRFSFLFIMVQFIFLIKIIIISIRKKDRKLNHYVLCLIPFILAFSSQLIAKLFFNQKIDTLLLAISWIAVIFLFLGILIIHFVRLANEVEYMNRNLERLVTERTDALEKEKNRALKEIDLAGFVQRSFYRLDTTEIKGWDIKLTSKPMAGVSGDLYMAFLNDNHLEGFGIFDISGHGIASGLVTMLVKNIIEQEFKKGLKKPLHEVMSRINNRIIIEKGNIENYLTGMLIRFNKDGYELVNAGHPKAILYSADTKDLHLIENDGINQFGAIGIPDLPVNFQTVHFDMKENDELILYTDGITECINEEKRYFGIDGIMSVIKDNISKDLEKQVNALPEALFKFSGTKNLGDDITYIILKKLVK